MIRWLLAVWMFSSLLPSRAGEWSATSVWGYPVPVVSSESSVVMSLPDSSGGTPLVAFLTTTDTPGLLGDLRGSTLVAVVQIDTTNSPIMWWGNDCGGGDRHANMRLYFSTTSGPYVLATANSHETNYWWEDYAFADISAGKYGAVKPGLYVLMAPLDWARWSNSQGHQDARSFYDAASRVAQVGLAFGGGCFFDVGVGLYNPYPYDQAATLRILSYRVIRPKPLKNPLKNPPARLKKSVDALLGSTDY